ncbi:MAG: glycosyltransferase family 4 protein [Rubrivivax sp.]
MPAVTQPVLVVGTASIHVRRFVAGLCEAGQRVVLITSTREPLVPHERLQAQEAVDFSVRSFLRTPRRIRELILRWRPGVVHVHQANSVAWHTARALRGTGVPMVLTLWGSDVLLLPQRGLLHRAMVRHALRAAAAWTADARTVLEAAQHVAGQGASAAAHQRSPAGARVAAWIPLGIDEPPPAQATELAAIGRERRLLSCRLHKPLYRIDAIVRAFAQVAPACPGWVLEVAAAGEQTQALKQLAASLGLDATRVAFTGMLDAPTLARAYRRSAIFVSVPESDGTSVSLLEAMGAGCLPVLSDLPANREWVREGDNGLLVADPVAGLGEALRRAITWFESGAWAREGAPANAKLIAERATLRANVQQFLALHDQVRFPPRLRGGTGS